MRTSLPGSSTRTAICIYRAHPICLILQSTGGSVAAGLGRMDPKHALVIGVDSDLLFPLHQQRELADGLLAAGRDVEFVELPSIQGHDSFLVDMDRFRPVVHNFLQGE